MASNFVISYNGREGSTAIINSLSWQNGIRVPLMEDLDPYEYLVENKARDIPRKLDEIFSTGSYSGASHNPKYLLNINSDAQTDAIGFKWRIFGDLQKIAEVFNKHDVTVVSLFRRDFLDIVCSSYAHKYGNKIQSTVELGEYPQFKVATMDEAELKEYFAALSAQEFRLVSRWFWEMAGKQVKIRKSQNRNLNQLARYGVKMKTMFYEDFNTDPERFITSFMADIGMEGPSEFNPRCDFVKVHKSPISERIMGLSRATEGFTGLPYRYFKREYDSTLDRITKLAQATTK